MMLTFTEIARGVIWHGAQSTHDPFPRARARHVEERRRKQEEKQRRLNAEATAGVGQEEEHRETVVAGPRGRMWSVLRRSVCISLSRPASCSQL